MLMRMASAFINIPLEKVSGDIQTALTDIGAFVEADRAYIFDYNHERKVCSNTHEYCAEGISPEIDNLQDVPFDLIPDWCNEHFAGRLIYIPVVENLPEGNLRDLLAAQSIRSLISIPMMSDGICLGFVGFDSVRTERKYDEPEINLLKLFAEMLVNITLRIRQEEAAQELTHRLEFALARETELNLMKTRFITMTSHQFRTPLTTIQASAELIGFGVSVLNSPEKVKLTKNINRILQEVERLTSLMNDVRFLGKAGSDRIPFEPAEHDLNSLLSEIVQAQEGPTGDSRKAELNIFGTPRNVRVDGTLFRQLICNILNNALKFSAEKPAPQVKLTYMNAGVAITISDSGIGVPEQDIPRLFETFYRASNVDNINGTGLGLAIAKHIVQLHQGKITFSSKLHQGSTVEIELNY